jgi:hypothetical protein
MSDDVEILGRVYALNAISWPTDYALKRETT